MRMLFLMVCIVPLCLLSVRAAAQSGQALQPLQSVPPAGTNGIEITVQRALDSGGEVYTVQASMVVVAATPQRSWQVMTDYDHLASFVPGFTASHLVTRVGNQGVLALEGFVRFLFIKQSINLLLDVHEEPYTKVDLTLLQGNMREYEAHWQLIPIDTLHTRILYHAKLAPTFFVPPLIGVTMMKSDLHKMLDAVCLRIEEGGDLSEPTGAAAPPQNPASSAPPSPPQQQPLAAHP